MVRGGRTGRGEALIKIKFTCEISVGMWGEGGGDSKMAQAGQH